MFSKREDTYIKIRPLGSGSYGRVYLVETIDGCKYAMKSIDAYHLRKSDDLRRHIHEINILSFNNSKYLLKLNDIYFLNDNLNLITPQFAGGNLDNYIFKYKTTNRKIPINTIWTIFIQICMGLKQLHFNGIIHRDIKPANILIDNKDSPKNIVICDFGASIILDKSTEFCKTCIGTPYFMSPEAGEEVVYTKKTDIWSLGCLLYELIMLEKPFVGANIYLLNLKIRRGSYKEIPKYQCNDYDIWNDLIKKMLLTKPNERINVKTILDNDFVKSLIKSLGIVYEKSTMFDIPYEFNYKNVSDYTKLNIYCNSISAYLKKNENKQQEKSVNIQSDDKIYNNLPIEITEKQIVANYLKNKEKQDQISEKKIEMNNPSDKIIETPIKMREVFYEKPSNYVSRIKAMVNLQVNV